jgi:hypothetical protein
MYRENGPFSVHGIQIVESKVISKGLSIFAHPHRYKESLSSFHGGPFVAERNSYANVTTYTSGWGILKTENKRNFLVCSSTIPSFPTVYTLEAAVIMSCSLLMSAVSPCHRLSA